MLLDEPDSPLIVAVLAAFDRHLASRLLAIELRRLALRTGLIERAEALLGGIALLPLDDPTLAAAERALPASVATLDAIHVATARRLADDGRLDAMLTYDARLANPARGHGITVIAPS